jgi:lipopolysaccharide/colanic/teichoic acid biosynthesis glycosyltransferase
MAPLFVIIPLLIKLDSPGPAFYSQYRVGLNRRRRQRRSDHAPVGEERRRRDRRQVHAEGKPFQIHKFRTMYTDAEQDGPVWASEDDPRVTRVGRFLRATRLDELPQLWNVVRGEMSLVGPRPERPFFVNRFARRIPHYRSRLYAMPGITGLAQVEHRYDADEDDVRSKLAYDLAYLKGYSIWRDLLILIRTAFVMVRRRGAR